MVAKICETCGKEYRVKNGKASTARFCSQKCHYASRRGKPVPHFEPRPQNKIECVCDYCGKLVYKWPGDFSKSSGLHFCSHQCCGEHKRSRIIVECDWCGREVEKNTCHVKRSEHNFCSRDCLARWQSENIIGEQHHLYSQEESTCNQCGKSFNRKPSQLQRSKQSFCSKECAWEYKRINGITEEQRLLFRATVLKTLSTYPRETSIEKAIREWLESHEIQHCPQHVINNKFCVDFYLPNHNVIIEALGDYFHANPMIYGEGLIPLNDMQTKNRKSDKGRFAYLRKCGYSIYGFWECNIKKDLGALMAQITEINHKREFPLSLHKAERR